MSATSVAGSDRALFRKAAKNATIGPYSGGAAAMNRPQRLRPLQWAPGSPHSALCPVVGSLASDAA